MQTRSSFEINVLLISRDNLFTVPGGDTIQIVKTAEHLRKLGVKAEVGLYGQSYDFEAYDLIHFFNIIVPEQMGSIVRALNIPYVVSTIFVDYGEYESLSRDGLLGAITRHLKPSVVEYGKVVVKALLDKRLPDRRFLFKGFDSTIRSIAQGASMLLPNSRSEMMRFIDRFGVNAQYHVVPNGVDVDLFQPLDGVVRDNNQVLCIARIEGLKNQLNLIRAVRGTGLKLKIVGNPAPNHRAYYEACIKEAGDEVEFISFLDQTQLVKLFAQSKVHVLPSWFETTGLVSLEAALMGCNIVVTDRGDVKDYFGDLVEYCEPGDIVSIRNAILNAAQKESNPELAEYVREHYTWEIAAKETFYSYKHVLHHNN